MSIPSKKEIIRLKISRANTTLKEARLLLENNFTGAALSRYYYACFYAASALLHSKDVFIKSHSGVKQMLGLHFVLTGQIDEESGRMYNHLFRNRLNVDYDDMEITDMKMLKKYSDFANKFVSIA